MTPQQRIAEAILACSRARDGRGRWRHEARLAEALGSSMTAVRVGYAASAIGAVIASFPPRPARAGARGGADVSSIAPATDLSAGAPPPRAGYFS